MKDNLRRFYQLHKPLIYLSIIQILIYPFSNFIMWRPQNGVSISMILSAFAHINSSHMIWNLISLWITGISIIYKLKDNHKIIYLIFIGTHLYNTYIDLQKEYRYKEEMNDMVDNYILFNLPKIFHVVIHYIYMIFDDKYHTTNINLSFIHMPRLGASVGVFGLMGFDFILTLKYLVYYLKENSIIFVMVNLLYLFMMVMDFHHQYISSWGLGFIGHAAHIEGVKSGIIFSIFMPYFV